VQVQQDGAVWVQQKLQAVGAMLSMVRNLSLTDV
jgi:hypothetical protein